MDTFTEDDDRRSVQPAGDSMPRVLLVEDNPLHVRLVSSMLAETWPELDRLVLVKRLDSALVHLGQEPVDCILLDLVLPDADGLEAVHGVKANHPRVPIVVLSAHDDEATAVKAVAAGVQDFLVKGKVRPDQLRRAILYAMERGTPEPAAPEEEATDAGVQVSSAATASVGLARLDLAGLFSSVDRTVCDILDRKVGEIIAESEKLMDPEDWGEFTRALEGLHAFDGAPIQMQVRFIRPTGEMVASNLRVALSHDGEGKADGYLMQMARVADWVSPVNSSSGVKAEQSWERVS